MEGNMLRKLVTKCLPNPMSETIMKYIRYEHRSKRNIKLLENAFYVLFIGIRLYCCFDSSEATHIIWANVSMLFMRTNIFNMFIAKHVSYALIVNYQLYIVPDGKLIQFWKEIIAFTSPAYQFVHPELYIRTIHITNLLAILVGTILSACWYAFVASVFSAFILFDGLIRRYSYAANLSMLCNVLILSYGIFLFLEVTNFAICTVYATSEMFNICFMSLHAKLRHHRISLRRYWHHFVWTLKYFQSYNRNMLGRSFLYILSLFSIIHTYSLIFVLRILLSSAENRVNALAFWMTVLSLGTECCLIFSMYFYLCGFSKRIHSSGRTLINRIFSERLGRRLNCYLSMIMIESIHKRNQKLRFGFTYSNIGLMTFSTFFKYVLFYGNLMMKISNLQRQPAEGG